MDTKRQKTSHDENASTHTLPVTHNGSTITVTVKDSRYDPTTTVEISVARADSQQVNAGTLTLTK